MAMQEADCDVIGRTAALLEEQATVYAALLDLSRRKQRVLTQGGLDELSRITRAEEALLWQAGRLEERRTALHGELSRHFNLDPGAVDLQSLPARLDGAERERCSEVLDHLRTVSSELEATNEVNTRLIQQALSYVNFSLQALARLGGGGATYAPGAALAGQARSLFDRRA